jgi:hypothetical protein
MTKRTRQNRAAALKAKVALAAIKGDQTLAELAQQFDVYLDHIAQWKAHPSKGRPVYSGLRLVIGELTLEKNSGSPPIQPPPEIGKNGNSTLAIVAFRTVKL